MPDSPTTEELIAGLDGLSGDILLAAHIRVTAKAAASRLEALTAENEGLKLSAERSEKDFYAVVRALKHWPQLPPAHVLMHIDGEWPQDWTRGKQMQNELGLEAIPAKTECELGAGFWDRITKPHREHESLTARLARLEGAAKAVDTEVSYVLDKVEIHPNLRRDLTAVWERLRATLSPEQKEGT